MSTLLSSINDPRMAVDPIHKADVLKDGNTEEANIIEELLAKWQSFSQSREGQIVTNLSDPMISYLETEICRGISDFPDMSMEKLGARRSELRGELRVWRDIKYNGDMLESRLNELNAAQEQEKARKIARAEAEPPSQVKKYT